MKTVDILKKFIWQIIVIVLLIVIFFKDCSGNIKHQDKIIIIPSKSSSFNSVKPIALENTKYKYKTLQGKTIYLDNPVNKELLTKYEQLEKVKDSLQLKIMYLESIQVRKYKHVFNDKSLYAIVSAQTTGTLDSLKLDYTIKTDTVYIPKKKTSIAFYLGTGVYSNMEGPGFKLNLGFQNKKGSILSAAYDPINKSIFIDYNFRLINIEK